MSIFQRARVLSLPSSPASPPPSTSLHIDCFPRSKVSLRRSAEFLLTTEDGEIEETAIFFKSLSPTAKGSKEKVLLRREMAFRKRGAFNLQPNCPLKEATFPPRVSLTAESGERSRPCRRRRRSPRLAGSHSALEPIEGVDVVVKEGEGGVVVMYEGTDTSMSFVSGARGRD